MNRIALVTGAGTGIGGLAILGVGIGLLASEGDDSCNISIIMDENSPQISHGVHGMYIAGWTLVGVGAALTVAGAVVAGVYGYRYTHNDTTVSFGITPVSASLEIAF